MKKMANGQSFEDFYNDEYIYIDKTREIYSLINYGRVFFSRPRRFGKSTVLDTIATLFENGVDPFFKDTWIYNKWTEKTYPVLRLNFLEFSSNNYESFCNDFFMQLSFFIKQNKFDFNIQKAEPYQCLNEFLLFLKLKKQQVVILIDEYDCQLTANISNPVFYEKFQQSNRSLYGVIKGKESIKFLGVTGVTRLKDAAIFSVGSDIRDVTYYSDLATLTGFTRDEIQKYYIDYINLAASIQNKISIEQVTDEQRKEILDRLAVEYNGYSFDESNTKKVFSTWSVNNFFTFVKNKQCVVYGDYWFENGGVPSILSSYITSHELDFRRFDQQTVVIDYDSFSSPTSLLTIDQNVLMCQTGYLTLKSPLSTGFAVMLDKPNNEVRRALNRLYFFKITNNNYKLTYESLEKLKTGTAKDIFDFFNSYLKTISYEKYPITNESILRGYLHIILLCYKVQVAVEVQNSKGRCDMQIDLDNRRIVLELKFAKDSKEVQSKLAQAICQIKERDYGNTLPLKQDVLRIALVFDASLKEFTSFDIV